MPQKQTHGSVKISTVESITGVYISVFFQSHRVTVEIKFVSPHAGSVVKEGGEGRRERRGNQGRKKKVGIELIRQNIFLL